MHAGDRRSPDRGLLARCRLNVAILGARATVDAHRRQPDFLIALSEVVLRKSVSGSLKIATRYYRAEIGRDCSSVLPRSSHRTRATIALALDR